MDKTIKHRRRRIHGGTSTRCQTLTKNECHQFVEWRHDEVNGAKRDGFHQQNETTSGERRSTIDDERRATSETMSSPSTPPPWPNNKKDYDLRDLIGVGATASVYSAYCQPRQEKCAIKRINLEKSNTSMDELLHEIQAMSQCSHDNVVNYYTSFVVGDELWVVMKLLSCGSLLDILRAKTKNTDCKHGVLDEATIATVIKEVLKGLEYFHNNGQIHRDIKAGNILLDADGTIQIADFGVSSWLATGGDMSRQKVRHTFVGTPCWMAPEVMEQVAGYDFKADIWSVGILAIELATGTAPYHKYPPMKVLMLTLQNDPPTLDSNAEEKDQYKGYGKTFRKMIAECLQKDPAKRPSGTELLKHPFFKKAKDTRWLVHALLETGAAVNLQQKAQQAKRLAKEPGVKMDDELAELVGWAFSSSDEDDDEHKSRKLEGQHCSAGRSSTSLPTMPNNPRLAAAPASSASNPPQHAESISSPAFANTTTATTTASDLPSESTSPRGPPINLVLRLRNANRDLNDIKFEFCPGQDTVEGVAQELVSANLIDGRDMVVVAANLQKVIDAALSSTNASNSNNSPTSMVFALNSSYDPQEIADERTLVGFAQLSIIDSIAAAGGTE